MDPIARTELNKKRVIELFGCLLFTYSLDRTKQIDRYRSISISISIHRPKYDTIKAAAAAAVAAAAVAAAAAVSKKKKKNYHG